ncbi:MAG: hypothetical protein H7641_06880, partial [Candidatus Heimdallarchaeota archaeon]|nr:hypothetical protein [Candidatus Heimdallarchaeota archaeon]MCK4877289.1 hypothetical protein [Candidatus Heimdallarchaeota archaeon]
MRKRTKISKLNFSLICVILVLSISFSQSNFALQEQSSISEIKINGVDNPEWSWTITEVLSTDGFVSSREPDISIDQLGNVYVTYSDYTNIDSSGTDEDVFLKVWNITSLTWSAVDIVSTESDEHSWRPDIVCDTNNNIHVSWLDSTNIASCGDDRDVFYKFWNATTLTWNATEVISTVSTNDSWDPSLGVDSFGNVYVTWWDRTDYGGAGIDNDVFFRRFDASTSIWSSTYLISTGSTGSSSYSEIGVDSLGNAHIIFRDNQSNYLGSGADIDLFHRIWNASTLSLESLAILSTESPNHSYGASVCMDSEENLHVAWQDGSDYGGAGSNYDIFYKYWNATTLSWSLSEVASTESPDAITSNSPSITVDPLVNIHVTWTEIHDYGSSGADMDVFYNFRNGTDSSWNVTEVVSTESADWSQRTELAADPYGNIHVIWEDMSNYLGSGTDMDVFYKRLELNNLPPAYLNLIVPNPSTTGNVSLNWKPSHLARHYYIYRDTSFISSLTGLSPLGVSNLLSYTDYFVSNDDYYYAIVAATPYINSTISNVESVVVNG